MRACIVWLISVADALRYDSSHSWKSNTCQDGADGYILTLKAVQRPGVSSPQQFAEKLQVRWKHRRLKTESEAGFRAEHNEVLCIFSEDIVNGLAARLDAEELSTVLEDDEVYEVTQNCLVKAPPLQPPVEKTGSSSTLTRAQPSLDEIKAGSADGHETTVYVLSTGKQSPSRSPPAACC